MSIKDEYKVSRIQYNDTKEWLLKRHYAKRMPCITKAFGLFKDKTLIGVCTFGVPASHTLCKGICGEQYADKVLELNRLCIEEGHRRNVASYFVARCLTFFRVASIIVSYADTGQGHIGYIYQATNWLYTGATVERTDPDGGDKHGRHVPTDGTITKRKIRHSKHRYVIFCGRKHWRKIFQANFKYNTLPYPKGETKRYDANAKITKQAMLFV
jgi:hypothetical protein